MAPLVAEVRVEEGVVPGPHRGEAAGETLRPRPAHTRLHHHGLADTCSTFSRTLGKHFAVLLYFL